MRRTSLLAAALAALLVVTGCSADGSTSSDGDDRPDPVVETEVTTDVDYVALGDSFSAGPFIGTMRTDPEGCARSLDNYPAFVADWLDVASYTDVTCSAATTADLYEPMQLFDGGTAPPQLDAVTADTDLVTLGLGGNDFGIYDSLMRCQGGASCALDQLRADTAKVGDNVRTAVRRIRRAAPDATVYVVGYPDILPTEGTCRALGLSAEALGPVTEVAALLNDALEEGAASGGASYVDLEEVSEGHDVCAGDEAWINGPRFRIGIAAPFHPLLDGMRATAAEVFRQVTGDEPDVTEYAEPDPDVVVLND